MNAEEFEKYKQSAIKILQNENKLTTGEIEMVRIQMEQSYKEVQSNISYEILFNMLTYTLTFILLTYLYFYI